MKKQRLISTALTGCLAASLVLNVSYSHKCNELYDLSVEMNQLAAESLDTAAMWRDLYFEEASRQPTVPSIVDLGSPVPPRYFNVPLDEELQSFIYGVCEMYDIADKYELVYALIQHESKFDPSVVSKSKDYGLMQINVCNHEYLQTNLGIVDFLDPYDNVYGGIYLLSNLLHKYDIPDALMAYNMGEGGAAKLWRRGVHSTSYSDQVLDYYYQFTENI